MNEEVMVVETAQLVPLFRGRAFDLIRDDAGAILDVIKAQHFFVPRPDAEVEPKWRQVIPYVVVVHGDDVFTLRRLRKQTEARLHDKVSIGIGGHINPGHDVLAGLQKELDEEVAVGDAYELEFAGILNDESTEVSRVHLGAVYLLRASSANVHVRETEKMTGSFVARRELAAMRDAMETWSQVVYDALLKE
ncbi:MAG TPA: NUDIX domain-containing protein [Thermoanaerobaculia bacterium]|jgi:predicted NUDIX family phosphoesterase|nr:NUDIX domain-containing protein [Thermoanaerobaculia bacterium]